MIKHSLVQPVYAITANVKCPARPGFTYLRKLNQCENFSSDSLSFLVIRAWAYYFSFWVQVETPRIQVAKIVKRGVQHLILSVVSVGKARLKNYLFTITLLHKVGCELFSRTGCLNYCRLHNTLLPCSRKILRSHLCYQRKIVFEMKSRAGHEIRPWRPINNHRCLPVVNNKRDFHFNTNLTR